MEIFAVVLVGFIIALATIVYFKSGKELSISTGRGIKPELPYKSWLKLMRTVFAGGTKDVQDKFLESEKQKIREWSYFPDFTMKFDALIKQFGK